MKYPKLKDIPASREFVDVFMGYNHNPRIGSGEFYDMKNLTSSNFPVLSTRHKRGIFASDLKYPKGIIAKKHVCYVDGESFVIDDGQSKTVVEMGLKGEKQRTLTSMGAYVIIMPDKKYINTEDAKNDNGDIEKHIKIDKVQFSICKQDGSLYNGKVTTGTSPHEDPKDGDIWYDTWRNILKQYSESLQGWSPLSPSYVKIVAYAPDGEEAPKEVFKGFKAGDSVSITGIYNDLYVEIDKNTTIHAATSEYIVVSGVVGATQTQVVQPICISRWMPDLDFIVESNNRLWGCRYGFAYQGKVLKNGELADKYSDKIVNEVYCSKLGDFKNWNSFQGISTDSYTATIGTDGEFTGAITHGGNPLFFKERCMHKVYGNEPSNFQIQSTECRGVQSGCGKSLAIVNEDVYYRSRTGICRYDGSIPVEISAALGNIPYYNAVGGAHGNKYYVSMADAENRWNLFVYDASMQVWHKEDEVQATGFCSHKGDLYFIEYADNQIKTVFGSGMLDETPIKWEAITGIIGTDSPDKKYVSRMDVRMALDIGSKVDFFAEYDSSGEWEYICSMGGEQFKLRTFPVPIKPKRCDHMRMKISGIGGAKIFSICKTVEEGSDE